jgi:CheY-like chemotaxis protein
MSENNGRTRILLIDDDGDDRELFIEALATVDPVVICDQATDGAEAFDRLCSQALTEPDIIFLDINMPIMNGWQFLSQVKNEHALKHIPVIVYTTSSNLRDRRKADALGALCFIPKPAAFRILQDMLGIVIAHVNSGDLRAICQEVEALPVN